MRIRQKLEPHSVSPRAVNVLPPIDGFSDPPLAPAVPPPKVTDENYDLWTVFLEDVDARSVRELWIDGHRFLGEARVVGGFSLVPLAVLAGAISK